MKQFTGKGVYGAVAMGKISLFKKQDTVIQRTSVTDTEAEKARVEAAKAAASEQLQAIYEKALKEVGETNAQIFEIHMMMLEDDDYNETPSMRFPLRRTTSPRCFPPWTMPICRHVRLTCGTSPTASLPI